MVVPFKRNGRDLTVIDPNRAALGKSYVFKLASHLAPQIQTSQPDAVSE